MRQIIVVWNKSDDSAFESNVPLLFNGERNRRLGSKCNFVVLFLEGMSLLSRDYREKLSALGFTLYDAESTYRPLEEKYKILERFSDYERKCFLRWLVIREIYGNAPFVHYDADIVFNATPEELEAQFESLTFILQGCPAYARVEDPSWLEIYLAELDKFVADIEKYSDEAWRQRNNFVPTFRARNSQLWNRRILSSDQDLLQFLTLSERLPQASADAMNARCSTALFQNPIVIGEDIHMQLPLAYERKGGIDYIGGRKVAFWHMQGFFCNYLGYASFCSQIHIPGRVPCIQANRMLSYRAFGFAKRLSGRYTRGGLARRYFDNSDDLGFLLNKRRFWQDGVFS